ncbi:MAG: glycoside hydrolase family 26 [Bacteroidetes bacterium]|nr:glycoside hydrolase family 26 [Bacteroidota bacterium]
MKNLSFWGVLIFFQFCFIRSGFAQLKSIIYDFEGQDIGQVDLPEGDYHKFDIQSSVAQNPLGTSPMLGSRVLRAAMTWSLNKGQFGKGVSRFIQLNAAQDYFNFYIYNPSSNSSDSKIKIHINEDDNNNNIWENGSDDMWEKQVTVVRMGSWQLISIPLNSFTDINTGGNSIFDAGFTNGSGKVFNVEFNFVKNVSTDIGSLVYLDMICFSEGVLPTGPTKLDLPAGNPLGKCLLGAFSSNSSPQTTPAQIQSLFPASSKKIKYVNWFIDFSNNGTTVAGNLPGTEVTQLLQGGYTPIITWEALYSHLPRLDPAQPRLVNFMNGEFDSYIDAFADKLKSYNDTIILRFMHEFEGDWYPWSLAANGGDPQLFINVFRKVVNRVRARGAGKVKWMWCVNGPTYHPTLSYNWIVGAYPGNAYVDIVACEVYNLTIPGIPYWRSFRMGLAEPYYYLRKNFPSKPLFICENGCRERYSTEAGTSETKPQWIAKMDQELQSNFKEVSALVLFDVKKSQDYRINSTPESLTSFSVNIWNDNYYFKKNTTPNHLNPLLAVSGPTVLNKEEKTILYTPHDSVSVYQWRCNDSIFLITEKNTIEIHKAGMYQVKVISNENVSWSGYLEIKGEKVQPQHDTITLKKHKEELTLMKIFPNPSNGKFTLSLCLQQISSDINVAIYDPMGKMYLERKIIPVNECVLESIEFGKEALSGIYILNVSVGTRKESTRILLAKE